MIARLALLWTFAGLIGAAQTQQEDIVRLARIKTKVRAHLDNMPNFTCLQTVERYQRIPNSKREELIDVLRLEVAYVSNREMYAWPGSTHFEDRELREIVSTGAFSTGGFALHARAIFVGEGTSFTYKGEETIDNKPVWRYDYATPKVRSGYQIRNPVKSISANVAYHGSIWADRRDSNLIRITIFTDEIPTEIEIESASDLLDYQPMKIGSIDALLPRQDTINIVDSKGYVSTNRTRLSRCKQYSGESTISFDDVDESAATVRKVERAIVLPPDIEITLTLNKDLIHGESAVGDPIEATLRNDIKVNKEVIAPKGSIARGRIVRFEHSSDTHSIYNITLLFEELRGADWIAPLKLRFVRLFPPSLPPPDPNRRFNPNTAIMVPRVERNGFLIFSTKTKLARDQFMIWQTQ